MDWRKINSEGTTECVDGLDLRKKKGTQNVNSGFWLEYCHLLRWGRPVKTSGFEHKREEEGWGRGINSYILVT